MIDKTFIALSTFLVGVTIYLFFHESKTPPQDIPPNQNDLREIEVPKQEEIKNEKIVQNTNSTSSNNNSINSSQLLSQAKKNNKHIQSTRSIKNMKDNELKNKKVLNFQQQEINNDNNLMQSQQSKFKKLLKKNFQTDFENDNIGARKGDMLKMAREQEKGQDQLFFKLYAKVACGESDESKE